jgi:hypothetical protein
MEREKEGFVACLQYSQKTKRWLLYDNVHQMGYEMTGKGLHLKGVHVR